jgi:hypothetical protein
MQDLNDLLYFAEVVDRGGFAAAGRAWGCPNRACRAGWPSWRRAWACGCCSAPPASCR